MGWSGIINKTLREPEGVSKSGSTRGLEEDDSYLKFVTQIKNITIFQIINIHFDDHTHTLRRYN